MQSFLPQLQNQADVAFCLHALMKKVCFTEFGTG